MDHAQITMTVPDILLTLLTVAVGTVAFVMVRTLKDIHRAADQLSKTLEGLQGLTTRLHQLADESERTVVSLRRFADEGHIVVGDLSATTARVRDVVNEGADHIQNLFGPLRYFPLLVAALKAGFEAYTHIRQASTESEPSNQEPSEGD